MACLMAQNRIQSLQVHRGQEEGRRGCSKPRDSQRDLVRTEEGGAW